ncbi:hypothetical protein COCNU_09G000890 [Cocos nucifera]|uniref:Uncharacterized protein n=1 Tax=Cocos nucifera TaxID=13894 RepID=A0A8K0IJP1_COCNU|nr:hypothetical protein COCNU_09G000890 [Cocos nucifera]
MALVKSTKENSNLLGINEALTSEMEVLKAQLVKTEVFEEGAQAALKDVEERMAWLQDDMGAPIEVATVRAVKKFWASKEYEDEQNRLAVNAYDEGILFDMR